MAGLYQIFGKGGPARDLQFVSLIRFGVMFLLGVILINTGIPVAVVGLLELVIWIGNLSSFSWISGGRNALLAWDERSPSTRNAIVLRAYLFFGIAGFLLVYPALYSLQTPAMASGFTWRWLLLPVFAFFHIACSPAEYLIFLRNDRNTLFVYTALSYGSQLISAIVVYTMGYGLDLLFLIWALIGLLRTVFIWEYSGSWNKHIQLQSLRPFFVFSAPLILHALLGGLIEYVDGWIVGRFYDPETFAIFRYGAREFPLYIIMVGAMVHAFIPEAKKKSADPGKQIKAEGSFLMKRLFPLAGILMLLSPFIYPLVYEDRFIASALLFNIYSLILISRFLLPQIYFYAYGKGWLLALASAGEIVLNVFLSLWMMQYWGIYGIAMATPLVYLAHKVLLMLLLYKKLGLKPQDYLDIGYYLAGTLFILLCFAVSYLYLIP